MKRASFENSLGVLIALVVALVMVGLPLYCVLTMRSK